MTRTIGVNYGPFREGQAPWGPFPSSTQIEDDMKLIQQKKISTIRIYGSTGVYPDVLAEAKKYGINVALEAWIDGDANANDKEIKGAIALSKKYQDIVQVVICGSEVILRGNQTVKGLVNCLQKLRPGDGSGIPANIPLGYADDLDKLKQCAGNAQFVNLVDWIGLDSYGFWECKPENQSPQQTMDEFSGLQDVSEFKGKHLVIAETGWPNAEPNNKCPNIKGNPTLQKNFVESILKLSANIDLYYMEFSDEPWKSTLPAGPVEAYWGLVDKDRNPYPAWSVFP